MWHASERKVRIKFLSGKLYGGDHAEYMAVDRRIILEWILWKQPPIQWVLGALTLGIKRPGREADHSPSSSADVKE
jgi:hypothetical protein